MYIYHTINQLKTNMTKIVFSKTSKKPNKAENTDLKKWIRIMTFYGDNLATWIQHRNWRKVKKEESKAVEEILIKLTKTENVYLRK